MAYKLGNHLVFTGIVYIYSVAGYPVKRSDVTRWNQGYITPPPPYFILWKAGTSLGENKVI